MDGHGHSKKLWYKLEEQNLMVRLKVLNPAFKMKMQLCLDAKKSQLEAQCIETTDGL